MPKIALQLRLAFEKTPYFGRQSGLAYLSILIMLSIIGIAGTASLQMGAVLQRRFAEEELLEIGAEFQAALTEYASASPPGQKRVPESLEDLLKDVRVPGNRRYLRKIYADPMTGEEKWGLLTGADGTRIIGIYSLSSGKPIKLGNFDSRFRGFEGKASFRDWAFVGMSPTQVAKPINQ